jgi:hypothetical protein
MMKVNQEWAATVIPLAEGEVEADQPPSDGISYSHLFTGQEFYVYGWISASDFSRRLLKFDIATSDWVVVIDDLPAIFTNCLALDAAGNTLYSVGGLTTNDGGETSSAFGRVQKFDLNGGNATTFDLPSQLAGREGLGCAFDQDTGTLFVSGGAVMVDNWDERKNTYHNDLWAWNGTEWRLVIADGTIGGFSQYDESWMLEADPSFPNFGRNIGKMVYDGSEPPRLILMGDVPGSATQVYTLYIQNVIF